MDPYTNLKLGLIKIQPARERPINLGRLLHVLRAEIGFEPIQEVTIDALGRFLSTREGLVFEARLSKQRFHVANAQDTPAETGLVKMVATLTDPLEAGDRIVVREWHRLDGSSEEEKDEDKPSKNITRTSADSLGIELPSELIAGQRKQRNAWQDGQIHSQARREATP